MRPLFILLGTSLLAAAAPVVNADDDEAAMSAVLAGASGYVLKTAPILEVNPGHPLIKALAALVKAKGAGSVDDAAQLLLLGGRP